MSRYQIIQNTGKHFELHKYQEYNKRNIFIRKVTLINYFYKLCQKDNFLNKRFIIPWIKRKFKAEAEFMLNKQAL